HQGGEDGFALGDVFEPHLQKRAAFGIHGRFPELFGGHFAEALVALDGVFFAALVQDVVEEFAGCVFLYDLGLFRAARWRLAGFLLGLFGLFVLGGAQIFVFAFAFVSVFLFRAGGGLRRFHHTLDHERRIKILLNLLELGD